MKRIALVSALASIVLATGAGIALAQTTGGGTGSVSANASFCSINPPTVGRRLCVLLQTA